jgi:hypothetical protein
VAEKHASENVLQWSSELFMVWGLPAHIWRDHRSRFTSKSERR